MPTTAPPRRDAPHVPLRRRGPTPDRLLFAEDVRELVRFGPVIRNLVTQDLAVRYQRSALGFLWTLLNPLLMMTTLAVVFSSVLQVGTKVYAIYLFAGMVPWIFLNATVNDCANCWIVNEGLIRRIYLPKLVFPLSRLLIHLVTFALTLVVLFVLMMPLGARPSWALLGLPLAVALLAAFALGLGLLAAVLNTFFRDVGHIVGVVLQAWYFATPILYEASRFSEEVRWRFWLNPAYPMVSLFQQMIRDGAWPAAHWWLAATGVATAFLGAGYAAYKASEAKIIFRL